MKKLLLLFVFIGGTLLANAQYTFYSFNYDVVDKQTKQVRSNELQRQIYNISLTDKVLVHNVFADEGDEIEDSQVYQITDMEELSEGVVVFTALSGVTGNSYEYRLKVVESGESTLTLVKKDDDYNIRYNGTVSTLKLFKQE